MFRTASTVVAITIAVAFTPRATADEPTLPFGKEFKGEIDEPKKVTPAAMGNGWTGYVSEFPLDLKIGQSIEVTASVTGKNRQVALALIDKTGKTIADTVKWAAKPSATLTAEANATGKYRLVIISDQIGGFTIKVIDSKAKPSKEEIQQRIKDLKEQLAKAEAELKALEAEEKKKQ